MRPSTSSGLKFLSSMKMASRAERYWEPSNRPDACSSRGRSGDGLARSPVRRSGSTRDQRLVVRAFTARATSASTAAFSSAGRLSSIHSRIAGFMRSTMTSACAWSQALQDGLEGFAHGAIEYGFDASDHRAAQRAPVLCGSGPNRNRSPKAHRRRRCAPSPKRSLPWKVQRGCCRAAGVGHLGSSMD